MVNLKGKIYWVMDDFSFEGNYSPKDNETAHTVTKIENVIVDEHMISFNTRPFEYMGVSYGYNVNLLIDTKGFNYSGTYKEKDGDWKGAVFCELFENKNVYFLFGKWVEDEVIYTWWARINKSSNLN